MIDDEKYKMFCEAVQSLISAIVEHERAYLTKNKDSHKSENCDHEKNRMFLPDLNRCEYCGSNPSYGKSSIDHEGRQQVTCYTCGTCGPFGKSAALAIDRWNRMQRRILTAREDEA